MTAPESPRPSDVEALAWLSDAERNDLMDFLDYYNRGAESITGLIGSVQDIVRDHVAAALRTDQGGALGEVERRIEAATAVFSRSDALRIVRDVRAKAVGTTETPDAPRFVCVCASLPKACPFHGEHPIAHDTYAEHCREHVPGTPGHGGGRCPLCDAAPPAAPDTGGGERDE